MRPDAIRTTFELAHTGRLPLWVALLAGAALLALCLILVRAEARRLRRRRGIRWLYVTRTLVVLAFTWLLVQPLLFIRRETTERGRLIVLVDDSKSMFLSDDYRNLSARLDLAQLLRLPGTERRSRFALDHAASLRRLEEKLARSMDAVQGYLDELEQGLPWGDSFTTALRRQADDARPWEDLASEMIAGVERLRSALSQGKEAEEVAKNDALVVPVREFVTELQRLIERLGAWREAPQMTIWSLQEIRAACASLRDLVAPSIAALEALQAEADVQATASGPEELPESLSAVQEMSRFRLASTALQNSGLLAELSRRHELEIRRLRGLEGLLSPGGAGIRALESQDAQPVTDFYEPLERLVRELSLELLSGIVLVTDGQQNSRVRPEAILRLVKQRIPLVAVGVGSTEGAQDLAIADYAIPGIAVAGKKAEFQATLKSAAPAGTRYRFSLLDGAAELARIEGEVAEPGMLDVASEYTIEEEGKRVLKLAVQWDGPDANPANNEAFFPVHVRGRKPKVLVVASTARWDVVYLLRALERELCSTDLVLTGEKKTKTSRGKGKGKIPKTLSELKAYDLVVLDGPPFRGLTKEDPDLFADHVEQAGGALLLLLGPGERDGGSYRQLLSARFPQLAPPDYQSPAPSDGRELNVAEQSRFVPAALLSAESEESRGLWSQLARPRLLAQVSPQAVPLVESSALDAAVFSLGFHGKGRIYQLGIGDLFRMREWHGSTAVNQLLSSLAQDALRPLFQEQEDGPFVAVYPPLPVVGQACQLLVSRDGAEATGVAAVLEPEGGESRVVELKRSSEKGVLWRGEFTPARPGPFQIVVTTGARRTEHKSLAASPLSKEGIYFRLDQSTLEELAEKAQGKYVHLSRSEEAIRSIPVRTRPKITVREVKLWNLKLVLLIVAALLTLDWVMRRKKGIIL